MMHIDLWRKAFIRIQYARVPWRLACKWSCICKRIPSHSKKRYPRQSLRIDCNKRGWPSCWISFRWARCSHIAECCRLLWESAINWGLLLFDSYWLLNYNYIIFRFQEYNLLYMGKKLLFKCDVRGCEKVFNSKFSMRRHNQIHQNKKIF